MYSFLGALVVLVLGYLIYGRWVDHHFGMDPNRQTPAYSMRNDVDFLPLPGHKIFLIQFLNIAGLGPIFGAVMGALYGPAAFLWIAFGCVFAGAVHDYLSGMLSLRHQGQSIPEVVGHYLGDWARKMMRGFSVVLMVLVGVVFMMGPAELLANLGMKGIFANANFWLVIILAYYFTATVLPIDKVISRIYPLFGLTLLIMAFGVGSMIVIKGLPIPEITNPQSNPNGLPAWPMLFVTIACGAISGFHATQSPMMARCLPTERFGRQVFYGAMIAEGVVALIWAAAAMAFFPNGLDGLNTALEQGGAGLVVNEVCVGLLGSLGGLLAILGVIACPVTTGDTAFRGVRLIVADATKLCQKSIKNRILLALPVFSVGFTMTFINFDVIWRYLSFSNQALATIVLWACAMYMVCQRKSHWLASLPATFMTAVCSTYIMMAPEGFGLSQTIAYSTGVFTGACSLVWFLVVAGKRVATPHPAL